jgi:predicted Rossmann fold flavoprotein
LSQPCSDLPIVVIGAGAAGTVAAIFAARSGRRVVLLERTRDGGRKILISGGGRCNVLPSSVEASQYYTASSPNVLRNILRSWPLPDQRRFFEEDVRLPLALEAESGKLFPASNRARDVRDGLLRLAGEAGAALRFGAAVVGLRPPLGDEGWGVSLQGGEVLPAAAVVLASGGLSVPATGSDGTGIRLVQQLGHTVNELYPALTPLTAAPAVHSALAGVSLEVHIEAPLKPRFQTRGGFLFTHRGYSGPSVLDVSHVAVRSRMRGGERQPIHLRWAPDMDAAAWERLLVTGGSAGVAGVLRRHLPARLVETLMHEAGVDEGRTLSQLRREERSRLVLLLTRYLLPWTGDEGYKKAEVTGGGVPLAEVDPRTLLSRVAPGLYLCGEILDAFGPIGGYNFFWAWATGRLAGLGAAADP